MTDQKIKILNIMRIVNPIIVFVVVLLFLGYFVEIPLVLAVSVASLSAIISFTAISMVLSIQNKKR